MFSGCESALIFFENAVSRGQFFSNVAFYPENLSMSEIQLAIDNVLYRYRSKSSSLLGNLPDYCTLKRGRSPIRILFNQPIIHED